MPRRFNLPSILSVVTFLLLCSAGTCPAQNPVEDNSQESAPAAAALQEKPSPEDVAAAGKSLLENINVKGLLADNPVDRWLILLGAIFGALVLGKLTEFVLRGIASRFEKRGHDGRAHIFSDLTGPAKLALLGVGLAVGLASIKMNAPLRTFTGRTLLLIYSIAIFWYAYNLVSLIEVALKRLTSKTESTLDDQLVPLIRKTLRVFLVVIAVLFIADSVFGQDIGAWLAGLGIAGLAVSLAAQDSLKNLFGSLTIILDQPFQMGERIKYAGFDGIVEEIGFRSTKVRTLTGHLVTIPNSNIVNDPVENVGRRETIRRTIEVTITYDTPRAKIEEGVEIIRRILDEPGLREPIRPVINGSELLPRVYFSDMASTSLNIFVIYWYGPPEYWDYMDHAQRFNLRLFEEFEQAGIEFAFPTQTVYLAGDPQRDLSVKMLDDNAA